MLVVGYSNVVSEDGIARLERKLSHMQIRAMFVSRKVVFGKPLSKLSYICLPLEKSVNGKHFPVKEKFSLVSRKVFS
jgi:hypothetical protein